MEAITSADEFHQALADSRLVMVDYYAKWCSPCKRIAPRLEALALERPDWKFLKVDTDELETEDQIKSLPTFVFYVEGRKANQVVGADYDKIVLWLDRLTPSSSH